MDSKDNAGSTPPQAGAQPLLAINNQFIKDLSFEVPGGAQVFAALQKTQPNITLNLDAHATPLDEAAGVYEVVLQIKADCKIGELVGFIVELVYAGIFTVNVPKEHLGPVLLIECPRLIFPFARNILAEVTRDGGFPPLMLGLVDFAGLYQARLNELAKQQGGAPVGTA